MEMRKKLGNLSFPFTTQFISRFCSYFLRTKKGIPSVTVRPLAVSASSFLRFYTGFVRPAPKPGANNKRRKYDFGTDQVSTSVQSCFLIKAGLKS
jgi:hypothetical protein